MYEKKKDIKAHFPYWSYEEVKYLIEKLIGFGVLIKGNFNKNPLNRTSWYAFADEKRFKVDQESCTTFQEIFTKREKSLMQSGKFPNAKLRSQLCNIGTDTKHTDTKPTDVDKGIAKERGGKPSAPPSPPPESHYVGRFDKVVITKEQRLRLVEKYGGMESLVDAYAEKLQKYALKKPAKFAEYGRHDMVIDSWIDDDLAKEEVKPKAEKRLPFSEKLNPVQLKNFQKNHDLVDELIADSPHIFGGLEFYYKAHVLRDKRSPNFSVSGLLEHRDFCRVLDKHFDGTIEQAVFGNVQFS